MVRRDGRELTIAVEPEPRPDRTVDSLRDKAAPALDRLAAHGRDVIDTETGEVRIDRLGALVAKHPYRAAGQ